MLALEISEGRWERRMSLPVCGLEVKLWTVAVVVVLAVYYLVFLTTQSDVKSGCEDCDFTWLPSDSS